MNVLLIVVAILVVGISQCQETVVYKTPVSKFGRSSASRPKPVVTREQIVIPTPAPTPRLYTNAYRETDHNTQSSRKDNFHTTPASVRDLESTQRLFLSIKIPAKMPTNQPSDKNGAHSRANQKKDQSDKNNLTVDDNMKFVSPSNNIISSQNISDSNLIPDVVDRSSFTGDQCPTGFVRVNGECVRKD